MKKVFFVLVISLFLVGVLSAEIGVTVSGRLLMEMVRENNLDWNAFDEDDAAATNDLAAYGHARVDLNFKAQINENVGAVIGTRFEGDDGDKWMFFGKGGNNHLSDVTTNLQEAYISIGKLFSTPTKIFFGRKVYSYGGKNIVSVRDKIDGMKINVDLGNFYFNLHSHILGVNEDLPFVDETRNKNLYGLNGGMKDFDLGAMKADVNAYFWMRRLPMEDPDITTATESVCDGKSIVGLRADLSMMDGAFTPYFEFATQMGENERTEVKYAGMLIDVGAGYEMELPIGTMSIAGEFFMADGDDADTEDNELFNGVGLSYHIEGWNELELGFGGIQMIKVDLGLAPNMCEKLSTGITFWMFNDNTKNIDNVSGENMYNELQLNASYEIGKNSNIYAGFAYLMPNEDMMGGEDVATALYFGSEVKF